MGDGGDHGDGASKVAAVAVALRTPALDGGRGAVEVHVGQGADGVGGHAGDLSSPLGGLLARALVGTGAHEVSLVRHVLVHRNGAGLVVTEVVVARRLAGLDVLGEGVGVEAEELLANEALVKLALGEEVVNHAGDQGVVGAGANGDPLRGKADGRVGQVRVDDDNVGVGVLQLDLREEEPHARTRHTRVGRVVAEQHDVLGVDEVGNLVVGPGITVEQRQLPANLARRVVAVMTQVTAPAVHKAGESGAVGAPGLGNGATDDTGAVLDVEGVVAVLLLDLLHGVGNRLDGLFPGNLLVDALAALRALNALERALHAGLVVDALARGTATHAGAQLGNLARAELVRTLAVGADANDRAVLDVGLQRAAATAVHVASAPGHGVKIKLRGLVGGAARHDCALYRLFLRLGNRGRRQSDACSHEARHGEERPAADADVRRHALLHSYPSLSSPVCAARPQRGDTDTGKTCVSSRLSPALRPHPRASLQWRTRRTPHATNSAASYQRV